jgi:ABC-type transport system involved in multi-copper enzyme maturation permease subunit
MTFLPIIERELRVRARSRAVYWTRFTVVLAGILVCLAQLMWSSPFWTPANLGRSLLNGLVSTAFLLSCGACLLTADVISSERREGTLGLLLLTRVNILDVLLGKLGSAGLTSLCALIAILPMLMLPVLAGGVSGGEAFRKGLVLPNTLFLTLAAGLWASAGGFDWLKTARTALLLVAALVLAPGLAGLFFKPVGAAIGLLSPLGTISAAGDASYKVSAAGYWISLLLVQTAGWALVLGAGLRLRSAWQEERGETAGPLPRPSAEGAAKPDGPWLSCSWTPPEAEPAGEGDIETAPLPSRPLGNENPIAWLLQRQRGIQALIWAGVLVGLSHFVAFRVLLRFLGLSSYPLLSWPLGLATSAFEGALFAWAASRFFVEARRTGELELLLTTPVGAREIVSAQWEILKRRLRWPILVMLAPTLLEAGYLMLRTQGGFGQGNSFILPYTVSSLIGCVEMFFGVGALCWVGLWFGLKAGGQARAIVWTASLVKGLPYLISILCSILFPVLGSALARSAIGWSSFPFWIILSLPQVVTLVLYVGLIKLARQRLVGELVGVEVMKVDLLQFVSSAARDASAAFHKARHWTPS